MMSASLPDEPEQVEFVPQTEAVEVVQDKDTAEVASPETKVEAPLHVMHQRWSAQKRLKKVQVETLESVYRRTKRPTVSKRILSVAHKSCMFIVSSAKSNKNLTIQNMVVVQVNKITA